MHGQEQKISLSRFVSIGELLDAAFPDPTPLPDYLAHECELAEHALVLSGAPHPSTGDRRLAALFALALRLD
jgi:hypothetical protein